MQILRSIYNQSKLVRKLASPARQLRRRFMRAKLKSKMQEFQVFLDMLAEDPVLSIDEFNGNFVVGRHSSILQKLIMDGSYEISLSRLLPSLVDPTKDAIDVGANLGFYSVLFAKLATTRSVLAFEPVSEAIGRLTRNLELNGVSDRVRVCPKIASRSQGSVEMKVVVGQEEYSTIGKMEHPNAISQNFVTRTIECVTVDSEVTKAGLDPGFMKIDAEGSEHHVIEGSLNTLRENRPLILAEISDHLLHKNGSSAASILQMLNSVRYVALDPFHPTTDFFARDFGDALFVPEERRCEIIDRIS